MKDEYHYRADEQQYYAPIPSDFVKSMRTNLIWQFIRFLVINYKMTRMIMKSHK
ncbi:MAG: hypothetical protein QNL04_01735 [SAR324 cluster bacterium]|nr:hypothetical protein [SAR324 cluster bacterium]